MRRRTAFRVLLAAGLIEAFAIWRFRHVESTRWSVLAALAAITIVAAVLDLVLSVTLQDPDSDVPRAS